MRRLNPFSAPHTFLLLSVVLLWGPFASTAFAAPSIKLSTVSGPPTSSISVSGRGFAPNAKVEIYFDVRGQTTVLTSSSGDFSNATIHAPRSVTPGQHSITAAMQSGEGKAQATFTVETDWTQGRYDPGNSGFNPYENVLSPTSVTGLHHRWNYPSAISTDPTIADGIVYFGDATSYEYALDAKTGQVLWQFYNAGGSIISSSAIADGIVYFSGFDYIYALDARTGNVIWKKYGVAFGLTVANGMLYYCASGAGLVGGHIFALDAKTGDKRWSSKAGEASLLSYPAVGNGVVYADSTDLVAMEASTGKFLWSYPIGNPRGDDLWSSATVSGGIVYATSIGGTVYAVDIASHALIWSYATGASATQNLAVGDGKVYVGSTRGLFALDALSGNFLWRVKGFSGAPALANGVLYVGLTGQGSSSELQALDANSGELLWKYQTIYIGSPAVADGAVYVDDENGMDAFSLVN